MQSLAEVMKISAVQILESNSYFNIRFETSTNVILAHYGPPSTETTTTETTTVRC